MRWPHGLVAHVAKALLIDTFQDSGSGVSSVGSGHQAKVIAGTIMEAAMLPLTICVLVFSLIGQARTSISLFQLSLQLAVAYNTT